MSASGASAVVTMIDVMNNDRTYQAERMLTDALRHASWFQVLRCNKDRLFLVCPYRICLAVNPPYLWMWWEGGRRRGQKTPMTQTRLV